MVFLRERIHFIYQYIPKGILKYDNSATAGMYCQLNIAAMPGRASFKKISKTLRGFKAL
jgi:hypothetical protein